MRRLAAILAALALLAPGPLAAHDIYTDLHSGFDRDTHEQTFRRDVGQLCCDGGPTGDCEALDGYVALGPGLLMIHSRRYNADVKIAMDAVAWTGVAGSEAPVHWCGISRAKLYYPDAGGLTPFNLDPVYWTYCIFIVPDGF